MKTVHLESSVAADKSTLQQVHPEALVAVHEVMYMSTMWPWLRPGQSKYSSGGTASMSKAMLKQVYL